MRKISKFSLILVCFLMVLALTMGLVACNEDDGEGIVVRQLTIEASQHGKVEAEKSAYADGETVTLTITKSAGYFLASIKLNDEEKLAQVSADGKTLSFVINADTTVKAVFSKIPTYAINIDATGGTVVSDKAVYNTGDTAKLTLTPNSYHELTAFTVDGVDKKSDVKVVAGKQTYEFVISQNVAVIAVFSKMANVNAQVSVASRYNLNGMSLVLTPTEGTPKTATVADGAFTIEDAELGTEYAVSGTTGGMTINLGKIIVTGDEIAYDPSVTENASNSLNLVNGSYVIAPDYHKGVNLSFAEPITDDAWFVTKMQISSADMAALFSEGEIVAGVSLSSNGQSNVENLIWLNPNSENRQNGFICGADESQGGSGVWTDQTVKFYNDDDTLTANGEALAGDGFYLVTYYESEEGMIHTYYGTSVYGIVYLRNWGVGAARSFEAGSSIDGISLGYVHTTWGTNPPCNITYSEVRYGATLADALGNVAVTLDEDNTFTNGAVTVEGSLYGDVVITFVPNADYGVGSVTVNGEPMTPDADGKITLNNYQNATVDVTAVFQGGRYAVTTNVTDANVTLEITDKDGNVVAPADLANVLYGTVLTVTAKPADGYMVKEGSFTIGGQTVFGNKHNFTVTSAVEIVVEAEASATVEGTLSAVHYNEYISSIEIYVIAKDGTNKYVGALTPASTGDVHDWAITVPANYTNFAIVLHDSEGRFVDLTIECADVSATNTAVSLIPAMTKYDVWGGEHAGNNVPTQNKLVLNADGSYSIVKTESGAALSNDDWWASGVATGSYFTGIDSKYWVLETDIVLNSAGGWNQWQAGLMVDEKEFIILQDRDWNMAAWTERNLATQTSGGWTDLISDEKAALAGLKLNGGHAENNWATSANPMKITAVRDDANIYIFLQGEFIGKYEVSASLFPNTSRGNSTMIGFMVRSGAQATFSNYWYELGEAKVDAYLVGVSLAEPTVDVTTDVETEADGATVEFYKQQLVYTDNSNGYKETTEWVPATATDFVKGAYLKMVVTPSATTATNSYLIKSVKLNGETITIGETGGGHIFTLTEAAELDVEVDVKGTYAITVTQPQSGATIVIKDSEGNTLEGDALANLHYGTVVTVNVMLDENTVVADNGLTATVGETPTAINNGAEYTIVDNVTFAVELVTSTTVSGTINVDKYGAYVDELTVSINDGAYTGEIVENEGVYSWSAYVPTTLTDITVAISSSANRFNTIEIEMANVEASVADVKLVPALTDQSPASFTNFQGTLNGENFVLERLGDDSNLGDTSPWANQVAVYGFNGINSDHWIVEGDISNMTLGVYNFGCWGIMLADNEYLMLIDRDKQVESWSATGSKTWDCYIANQDLLGPDSAASYGLVSMTPFAGKVAVVRDGNDIYLFLQDKFVGKYDIATYWPRLVDTASTKLGFMSNQGTEYTISNYWYTEDATEVAEYINGKAVAQNTISTSITGDYASEVESIGYLLEIQNIDGTWRALTDSDYYVGAYVRLTVTAPTLSDGCSASISATLDGANLPLSGGVATFNLTSTSAVVITAEITGPFTSTVTVDEQVNLDGLTLTLTPAEGSALTATVADGAFALEDQLAGDSYTVTTTANGANWNLGTLSISGKTVAWNPVSALSSDSNNVIDLANNAYNVAPSEHGIQFDFANPVNGSVYVATKVRLDEEDLRALLASNDDAMEIVFGIALQSADQANVPLAIQLKASDGTNTWICSDWTSSQGVFFTNTATPADRELTALGNALIEDGLYFIAYYDATDGMTYTYYGTNENNVVKLRDWGSGSGRSFTAGSELSGFSIGLIHDWGRTPFNVHYSEVGYGSTLADALGLADVVLSDDSAVVGATVSIEGRPYENVTITLNPNEGYTYGEVKINGTVVELDENNQYVLTGNKSATVKVEVTCSDAKFAVTSNAETANYTVSAVDANGDALDLSAIPYGTVATITLTAGENTVINTFALTMGGESIATAGTGGITIRVLGDLVITCETVTSEILSGTISAEHYTAYADELIISAGNGVYNSSTKTVDGNNINWTLSIPNTLEDKAVTITTANNRFVAITTANGETSKLIPTMTKYDIWGGEHAGNNVPTQNKLVLNEDGSYSIVKTESGAALSNDDWWASGVATGSYFTGIDSKYWVLETDIVLNSAGGWNQWHAGLTIDQSEFIMIMDRDWQLNAWTEWNLATSSSGFSKDIITNEQAARVGIVSGSNWGTSANPMKITAVRDDANIYIFLQGEFIGKYEVSASLFPNTSRGNSTKIGFMVKSGTEATFSNYWYELGETSVDAYLASKKCDAPTVNVTGGSYEIQKQVLVSTDSDNGYAETTEWVTATADDYYVGAYLRVVALPDDTHSKVITAYTGIDANGIFTLAADTSITIELEQIIVYESVNVTIEGNASMVGGTIKLVSGDDVQNVTVDAAGTFTLADVTKNDVYTATAIINGIETSLGTLTITNHTLTWNLAGLIIKSDATATNDVIDLANNTYSVSNESKHYLTFNFADAQSNDVYALTKVKMSEEDVNNIIASGEVFINVDLLAGNKYVQHAIQFKNQNSDEKSQLIVGTEDRWTSANILYTVTDGVATLTEYGEALKGDGLYFGISYDYETGLVYTLIGSSLDNVKVLRDWGTKVDSRSFAANTAITGFRFGTYFYGWGNAVNVTFSDVFVSKTQAGVVNKNVLLNMSAHNTTNTADNTTILRFASSTTSINGTSYSNTKVALAKDTTKVYGNEAASSKITVSTVNNGKSIVPYFQGFNFTDISAYSTIKVRMYIDETTVSEGFALNVRTYNKTAAEWQTIVAGEWVELTFNIADFTHQYDPSTGSTAGYISTVNKASITNLGLVFIVSDTETMSITEDFAMHISNFVVE